jgi:hypothetical protein
VEETPFELRAFRANKALQGDIREPYSGTCAACVLNFDGWIMED